MTCWSPGSREASVSGGEELNPGLGKHYGACEPIESYGHWTDFHKETGIDNCLFCALVLETVRNIDGIYFK